MQSDVKTTNSEGYIGLENTHKKVYCGVTLGS
jgi:hypothetical protein